MMGTSKTIFWSALLALLLLGGCSSSPASIAYDDPAPPEKKCTLIIAGSLTVTRFDGKTVEWTPAFGYNWGEVQIAQGSHNFVADFSTGGGQYNAKNITASYNNFKAGHRYRMVPRMQSAKTPALGSLDVSIVIEDITP
ncbi:MAG: hypothetical protein LBD82_01175 [Deltaproteobacteria bacterium]|jgi:hypothetical protein|nr:hypothetical protein [Deltaproteobacteria bacterium]